MPVTRAIAMCSAPILALGALWCGTASAQGTETFTYSFPQTNAAPKQPDSGLTYYNGNFYGESAAGAKGSSAQYGAIFDVTPTGSVKIIADFSGKGAAAAFVPSGGLTYYKGLFYGVCIYGGTTGHGVADTGDGVVFAMKPSGTIETLYNFGTAANDGAQPYGGLTVVNGTLYGTTQNGGVYGHGTIFSVSTTGVETVLHSFAGGTDGAGPDQALVAIGTTLYGTTTGGGSTQCTLPGANATGCGALFASDLAGNVTILHSFVTAVDGAEPAALLNVGGTLFGTTTAGASAANCGTAFSDAPGGGFATLHVFAGAPNDACTPTSLALDGSTFYGTAISGPTEQNGTIFAMTSTGQTSLDFQFDGTDGDTPNGPLVLEGSALFGTTKYGGTTASSGTYTGKGTIFGLTP